MFGVGFWPRTSRRALHRKVTKIASPIVRRSLHHASSDHRAIACFPNHPLVLPPNRHGVAGLRACAEIHRNGYSLGVPAPSGAFRRRWAPRACVQRQFLPIPASSGFRSTPTVNIRLPAISGPPAVRAKAPPPGPKHAIAPKPAVFRANLWYAPNWCCPVDLFGTGHVPGLAVRPPFAGMSRSGATAGLKSSGQMPWRLAGRSFRTSFARWQLSGFPASSLRAQRSNPERHAEPWIASLRSQCRGYGLSPRALRC